MATSEDESTPGEGHEVAPTTKRGTLATFVKRNTLAMLLGEIAEERRARVESEIRRDHLDHNERMAAQDRANRLTTLVMFMSLVLVVGLLAVVGVYVTVGFPAGGSVEAMPEGFEGPLQVSPEP